MDTVRLLSPLPPDQCAARLATSINHLNFEPVAGKVKGSAFKLRKFNSYANPWQPRLIGTMQPHDSGTLITAHFCTLWFTRVWSAVLWIGLLIMYSTYVLFGDPTINVIGRALAAAVPCLIFGLAMTLSFRFSRYLARGEPEFLTNFLMQLLKATSASEPIPDRDATPVRR